jgi:putative phosphoesterase
MKIGLMADSHENMPMIARAVALFDREGTELVLHAGDIISPITAKEFVKLQMHMIAVFGNNDGEKLYLREKFAPFAEIHERAWEGEAGGRRILMIHAPDTLAALEASDAYDVIVYGHTHKAVVRKGKKTLVVNPGECCGWITGRSTVAILDTETMEAEIRDL